MFICPFIVYTRYLAANFGFFEVQSFPWSPSKVEVGTYYLFTLKVGSRYTYIMLASSSVKPTIVSLNEVVITIASEKAKANLRQFFIISVKS